VKTIRKLSIALFATLCASTALAETKVTFFVWAGSNQGVVPTEVIEKYRKDNPNVTINILESNNTVTYPQMVTVRRTDPNNPFVHCGYFNIDSLNRGDLDDMWEAIDTKRIPNLENYRLDQFGRPDNRGVPYTMSVWGLLYNTEHMKEKPDSWSILWDPKMENRITMYDYDVRMISLTARMNGGDERNINPAFKVWSEHAKNFRALNDSNDATKNLLTSGDAWIAPWSSATSAQWIKDGAPLAWTLPKEGGVGYPLYLAIVNGVNDDQRRVCEEIINELLTAENNSRYALLTNGISLHKEPILTDEQKNNPTQNIDPNNIIMLDYPYISTVVSDWRRRWDREVKSKM